MSEYTPMSDILSVLDRIALALDKIGSHLERIQVSEGPCGSTLSRPVSAHSTQQWHCILNALHTGLHTDGKQKRWTDEEADPPRQPECTDSTCDMKDVAHSHDIGGVWIPPGATDDERGTVGS